ncbi:uncharacterized protein LOC120944387 [Rana temporaria]|uniref:uncharacterized protein LOC120944387 n=1 Tax=Rana temporaria TaxID=8407 RepID=UPI001AACE59D|nr:uncharacterized protein LOC120944387 [Rana temporaria]
MPVYYDNFQNNPDHSNDAKDYFQYYRPDDFGNPQSMQGNPTYDADGIGVNTRSYDQTEDQVSAAIEPQDEPTNEEDQVTAATEPQEEPTNDEDQVFAATEPQEDLTNEEDQVFAATEHQEDLTNDEDQVFAATEPDKDLTNDEDQVFAATEHQEYLIKGPFQVAAATKQQEELTDEELRELEVQNLFNVKENKIIDIIIGVGAAVLMLLILLGLGGRQIYLKLKKRRLKSKWKEAKRKKGKRRVPEVTVEEGLPNDTDATPPQNTPQESLPTTSERRNDKQKRGKQKVPEVPVESPPTTSTRKEVTFDLPLQRSPSPPSSLTGLSIVPSVESGNTSQSAAKVPLVEFPIDPSNAVTSTTIYYGQSSAASSITFQFISKIDKVSFTRTYLLIHPVGGQ